jgi:molybdenum ABC transporter molybdate-binding protein
MFTRQSLKRMLFAIAAGAAFTSSAGAKPTEITAASQNRELNIGASPELSSTVTQVARLFEEKHGEHVHVTVIGSSDAARLTSELKADSAPDALFFADLTALRRLAASGTVVANSITPIARDQMVICVSPAFRLQFPSRNPLLPLRDKIVEHIAIADPRTSFGKITMQTLRTAHVYDVTLKRKLLVEQNVAAVSEALERGDAELALLPKSALQVYPLRGARVITVPSNLHPPMLIGAGVPRRSKHQRDALALMKFAASTDGKAVFHQFGFK